MPNPAENTVPLVWLTPKQAGEYVTLAPGTLERFRREGKGPRFRAAGNRRIVYHIADLDAWLREGEGAKR